MILEQIAAATRLRLIEEKKLVSPEEMKEKALELLNDKQKLALFGHEARLNAEDYSYDSVKEKWLSIINDILN